METLVPNLGSVPAQPLYRIYVDDSGEKEYGPKTSQFFVYAGVVVAVADEPRLNADIAGIKQSCFGRTDIELKSNWLRIPREREKRYLNLPGVTLEKLKVMVEALHAWAAKADLQLVAAVIDKPQMQRKYAKPWHPSATAYLYLLQRYQREMGRRAGLGYVTVDDMEGASPAQNQWRDLLRKQHRSLKKDGCPLTKLRFDNVAADFRFGASERFHLLQLADLVAYSVLRQFRQYGEHWDDPLKKGKEGLPMYPWLRRLLPRFMRGPANQLQGWGIVKWPSLHTGRWTLTPDELRGA